MIEIDKCDVVAVALTVFQELQIIAVNLAAKNKLPNLGTVATKLYIASTVLRDNPVSQTNVQDVLDILERACKRPELSKPHEYSVLVALVENVKEYGQGNYKFSNGPRIKEQVEQSLKLYAVQDATAEKARRRGVFVNSDNNPLTLLSSALGKLDDLAPTDIQKKKLLPNVNDYPSDINKSLYQVVQKHLRCSCAPDPQDPQKHPARLCLKSDTIGHKEYVHFDMLILGQPQTRLKPFGNWQQVRFLVPRKEQRQKATVTFLDQKNEPQQREPRNNMTPMTQDEFCQVINQDHGPIRMCFRASRQGVLSPMDEHVAGERIKACKSVSLTEVLLQYRLSGKMKLVMAYILAQAVWQFYGSDWMKMRWSTDSIHFIKEIVNDVGGTGEALFATDPYFVVQFASPCEEVMEYHGAGYVAHRYPRLLALGNLLIDIGREISQCQPEGYAPETFEQQINADCAMARSTFKDNTWPSLGTLRSSSSRSPNQVYKDVVQNCFNARIFLQDQATSSRRHPGSDLTAIGQTVEERRAIVHREIVTPLQALLEDLGWTNALRQREPLKQTQHQSRVLNLSQPSSEEVSGSKPAEQAFLTGTSSIKKSEAWIMQAQLSYGQAMQTHRYKALVPGYQRIKIAVLDTGFDPRAEFFASRDRKPRLKGWRDCVNNSSTKLDDDGHGSKVLSLVMKMAPLADIYFARVARDSEGLKRSSSAIAEAIKWASVECDADVVSMSFGFANEELVEGEGLVSDAIREAVSKRKDKILFFGAVGNEGANLEKVRFPARHNCVIPIYGTNANGVFLDSLNPGIEHHGPAIYGSLAEDVLCAGRADEGDVTDTGTSFATAIVAGTAASILEYAQMLEISETENALKERWKEALSRQHGMLEMFRRMFGVPADRRYYLKPSQWFQKSEEVRKADIIKAVDSSR